MSRVNVVFETRRRSDGKYECVFRTPDGKESVWEPFDSDAEAAMLMEVIRDIDRVRAAARALLEDK